MLIVSTLDKIVGTLQPKNVKSKDYCKAKRSFSLGKADHYNIYCFFITIFRLAIPIRPSSGLTDVYYICKPEVGWYSMASRNIVMQKQYPLLLSALQ